MGYTLPCRNCNSTIYTDNISDKEKNYICPNCNSSNWVKPSWDGWEEMSKEKFLLKRVVNKDKTTQKKVNKNEYTYSYRNKYPVLKTVSGIYNIVGMLSIVIAVLGFIWGVSLLDNQYTEIQGLSIVVLSIIYGVIASITSKFISEGILLFIDIANDLNELKSKMLTKPK